MSKVASLTISAKSPSHRMPVTQSSRDEKPVPIDDVTTSSDSEEEPIRVRRRSKGSMHGSPERKRSTETRQKVYDEEKGLIHTGRSGRMSARQKTLEKELNTADPSLVSNHDEARAASSDDGLEDRFISRETKNDHSFYMVKEAPKNGTASNVYEERNVDAPRKISEPAGNRVRSATGQLMDNYEKDQSFDELSDDDRSPVEKSYTPVSELKKTYTTKVDPRQTVERSKVELELDQIRRTFRGQGMMQNDDSDGDDRKAAQEPEVLFRKPLKSIKNRFLAAASGHKEVASDSDGETAEEPEKEEILASPTSVNDLKRRWQTKEDWHSIKVKASDEINSEEVGSARNAFRQMELKKETDPSINRPVLHQVKDPKVLMDMRRHKTYGEDDDEVENEKENMPPINRLIDSQVKDPKVIMEIRRHQTDGADEEIIAQQKEDGPLVCRLVDHQMKDPQVIMELRRQHTYGDDKQEVEKETEEIISVHRLIEHQVKDPEMIMKLRRHQTYGNENGQVDGVVVHLGQEELASVAIDTEQIKEARRGYERLEESKKEKKIFVKKPSMKLIKQEQVMATMDEHRRKVSGEDWALEQARKYSNSNGHDESAPLESMANGNHDA